MLMLIFGKGWGLGKLYNTQTTGFLDELVPGGDTSAETAPDVMSCIVERTQLNGRVIQTPKYVLISSSKMAGQ